MLRRCYADVMQMLPFPSRLYTLHPTPYTLLLAVLLCGVPETLVAFWGAL